MQRDTTTTRLIRFALLAACVASSELGGANARTQAAQLAVGAPAPPLKLAKLLQAPLSARVDWNALKGKTVIVEFWATWCGPCIAAIPHLNQLVDQLSDKPVVFLSITDDPEDRLVTFLSTRPMKGWIGIDPNRTQWETFNVLSIPHTIVIGPTGLVSAITFPEYVTAEVIQAVMAGRAVTLPSAPELQSDLEWDQTQIEWQDGVSPIADVIIKPIRTATSGVWPRREGNYVTADGASLDTLIQVAYSVDHYHLDERIPIPSQQYRMAARVPKGMEAQLLPLLQNTLTATFGFKARWELQERDVLVLSLPAGSLRMEASVAPEPFFASRRGGALAKRQPMARLAEWLTNELGAPVVDETSLAGVYDWDLPYQPGQPNVTMNAVKEQLGLEITKNRRQVKILIVESGDVR